MTIDAWFSSFLWHAKSVKKNWPLTCDLFGNCIFSTGLFRFPSSLLGVSEIRKPTYFDQEFWALNFKANRQTNGWLNQAVSPGNTWSMFQCQIPVHDWEMDDLNGLSASSMIEDQYARHPPHEQSHGKTGLEIFVVVTFLFYIYYIKLNCHKCSPGMTVRGRNLKFTQCCQNYLTALIHYQ